jgi:hypothetical protein
MGEYDNAREVLNPTPEQIEQSIDALIPVLSHFVILSSDDEPVQNCEFVQTLILCRTDAKIEYLVEARFADGEAFKHYGHILTDVAELKRIFRLFALGIAPKVDAWRDITDKIIEECKRPEG